MADRAAAELRAELEATAPSDWPRVFRTLEARRVAAELLPTLDVPPSSHSRLGWELRVRLGLNARLEAAA